MWKKKQRKRFEEIVKEYTPRIFRMIYNMTGDYENTSDLTQDVFMNAWNAFDHFRGDSSIYTWLYRIALNRVFQYRKRAARYKTIPIDDIFLSNTNSNPEKGVIERADKELVKRLIQNLPEKHQDVLILRYYEGKDYSTIADILNIPIGTVRSRLHRSVSTLTTLYRGKK